MYEYIVHCTTYKLGLLLLRSSIHQSNGVKIALSKSDFSGCFLGAEIYRVF